MTIFKFCYTLYIFPFILHAVITITVNLNTIKCICFTAFT